MSILPFSNVLPYLCLAQTGVLQQEISYLRHVGWSRENTLLHQEANALLGFLVELLCGC